MAAAPSKRVTFSLVEVNDLVHRLQVLNPLSRSASTSPQLLRLLPAQRASSFSSLVLQASGHLEEVPATHTREKCVALSAVRSGARCVFLRKRH